MYGRLLLSYFYDSQLDDAYGNKKKVQMERNFLTILKSPVPREDMGDYSIWAYRLINVIDLRTLPNCLPMVYYEFFQKLVEGTGQNCIARSVITIVGEDIMKCGMTADKLQTFFQQECNCTLPRIIFTKFCEMLAGEQKRKYNKPSVTPSATSSATNKQGAYIIFCSDAAKTRT